MTVASAKINEKITANFGRAGGYLFLFLKTDIIVITSIATANKSCHVK